MTLLLLLLPFFPLVYQDSEPLGRALLHSGEEPGEEPVANFQNNLDFEIAFFLKKKLSIRKLE